MNDLAKDFVPAARSILSPRNGRNLELLETANA
jgi:hypothetical protein